MKKILAMSATLVLAGLLSACSGMNNADAGMVAGGVVGGVAGNVVTGGSALGTGVGAVGGAVVGRELAR